jgi:hypothetical protein
VEEQEEVVEILQQQVELEVIEHLFQAEQN